eukprot:NODE_46_length_32145_cov_0.918711.p8 type:complete len:472 gc:universal NODE_46_length_32145_cov_0.918711:18525-19940(+)
MIHSPTESSFASSVHEQIKPFNMKKYTSLLPSIVLYFAVLLLLKDNVIALFCALFVAIIGTELKLSIIILMALLVLSITVELPELLSGYQEPTLFLVWSAFHLGTAIQIHLSSHISIFLLYKFCFSWYSMSLCIIGLELLFASVIPSNTARGGLILPIVQHMMDMLDLSYGTYLTLLAAFANLISASTWMFGMATNSLIIEFMTNYKSIKFTFFDWLSGAILPTLVISISLPFILKYFLLKDVPDHVPMLRNQITADFLQLPKLNWKQFALIGILLGCLVLWMSHQIHNISSTIISMFGLLLLLSLDIISWDDVLKNKQAWDAFFWLGGFISIVNILQSHNITSIIGSAIGEMMQFIHSPILTTMILTSIYFFSMYMFSGCSSHLLALAPPILMSGIQLGCPPKLLLALMAYFTTLSGLLTYYSSGPIVMYYSLNLVQSSTWLKMGLIVSLFVMSVYFTIGLLWFKILGFY